MNTLILANLLIDFGLVVLIWMVQLIIYPSFLHHDATALIKWHKIYTKRITVIVAPLMLAQLLLSCYLLIMQKTYAIPEIAGVSLIAINWLITMLYFIGMHEKIDKDTSNRTVQEKLVQYNWIRVVLFCTIFIIHIMDVLGIY